jgi:chemotaxis protein CheD
MVDDLAKLGVAPVQCEAKIFGGGNMFPEYTRGSAISVGQRNGEAARDLLQTLGISVISESLFGNGHRQIIFDVSNGDVWSRQLSPTFFQAMTEEALP